LPEQPQVSTSFQAFMQQAAFSGPWLEMVEGLAAASALDPKTRELAYLAVLAALRMDSGLPFHVQQAKRHGASNRERRRAILRGGLQTPASERPPFEVCRRKRRDVSRQPLRFDRSHRRGDCGRERLDLARPDEIGRRRRRRPRHLADQRD
jgi:hypothetical protein